LFWLFWFFIR